MPFDPTFKPKLRLLEPFPLDGEEQGMIGLRDPSGLSPVALTVSEGALHLMALMDGEVTCEQIRSRFRAMFGQHLAVETLETMIARLEEAHFLEGESFEKFYASLVEEYGNQPVRGMHGAADMGIVDDSGDVFSAILAEVEPRRLPGEPKGVIAPHLDYGRGRPCYAEAYATLKGRSTPDRVVILGTNHFGRSSSVVATGKDFATPLGATRCDATFLERLEKRCGPLRTYELDHAREHSIELQVVWLQHLFGAEAFTMVPFLCPDPCCPTGTAPHDGVGVDLRHFARTLGKEIADDDQDTLLVASGDLSHVGLSFGDARELDENFLGEVRKRDQRVLHAIEANDPEAFLHCVRDGDNPTRVCGTGCIFALLTALPDAAATILGYHQAVTRELQNCVTCTAVAFA
jgi:AmmeMemoRadiSam system protein B